MAGLCGGGNEPPGSLKASNLHDDSSVRSYLDCAWVSTDILKRNSLDTPEDADIVIGYLFMFLFPYLEGVNRLGGNATGLYITCNSRTALVSVTQISTGVLIEL
ncbi:hypothetical protein ANN_00798 [Periplaneta americana]|uniref:Uncharacterized protein n=1 Tax=Periplaneta americana TaxID=6978 RepID=A0ABQ8TRY2_PERAM|nr:hypothetical protein ANN_00798 [Periplaneta americana]